MTTSSGNALVGLINETNHSTITPNQVEFTPIHDLGGGRTEVAALARKNQGYKGSVVVSYQRLGLTSIFKCFQPRADLIPFVDDLNSALLEQIYLNYGVKLDATEVDIVEHADDSGYTYTVTTNDTSLQYTEAVDVNVHYEQVQIDTVMSDTGDNYQYPTNITSTLFARVYSGGWYVPEVAAGLALYVPLTAADTDLRWLAQTLSGDDWAYDGLTRLDHNIYNGRIAYNGPIGAWDGLEPVAGRGLLVPPVGATNVLVVDLSTYFCSGLNGSLTFYY